MKYYLKTKFKIEYLLFLSVCFLIIRCNDTTEVYKLGQTEKINPGSKSDITHEEIAVSPPPFTDGVFPCNDCHAFRKPSAVRRKLEWHEDITDMFNHDLKQRDSLRRASGKLLDFKESYKLCGQCHGDKLRDWKVGVHGKRTGEWNGKKQYYLCVSCHNPHSPKFKSIKPEAPPFREDEQIK
jgi:formate-dependent nitrite reductase cytochrome c552 subunit